MYCIMCCIMYCIRFYIELYTIFHYIPLYTIFHYIPLYSIIFHYIPNSIIFHYIPNSIIFHYCKLYRHTCGLYHADVVAAVAYGTGLFVANKSKLRVFFDLFGDLGLLGGTDSAADHTGRLGAYLKKQLLEVLHSQGKTLPVDNQHLSNYYKIGCIR